MDGRPTVYVVDSDSLSRTAVSRTVQSMRLACEAFASGQEFLARYDASRPACLITEVRVPDVSGLRIQQRLAEQETPLPVIFLTAHATVRVVVRAMQAGAVHFLEKPPNEQELWDAIQEALREGRRRRAALAEKEQFGQRLSLLTTSERAVLVLLPLHPSIRSIAAKLGVSPRTVELRRSRIMRKLHFETALELLQFAIFAYDDGEGRMAGCSAARHPVPLPGSRNRLPEPVARQPSGGGGIPPWLL